MATLGFTCFGSAGDLFPVLTVAEAVEQRGHHVTVIVPRSLGALAARSPLPVRVFGTGEEIAILRDPATRATGRDGWDSWQRLLDHWIAPALPTMVAAQERILEDIEPDLVVTNSLSIGARLAAHRQGRRRLDMSIFPQWDDPLPGVAHRCRGTIAALAGDTGRTADPDDMLWGRSDPKLLLYDDALLDGWRRPEWVEVSGFPYRDLRVEPGETTHTPGADGDGQRVLVTFGSYLGPLVVDDLHQVVTALAIRAHDGTKDVTEVVVAGPRPATWPDDSTAPSRAPPVRFVGFVPLSEILDGCAAVVHHGGIGSMFATLHHGLPALVVPQAFDQPFNARAIAARAAGRNASADGITAGLDAVLAGDGARRAAQGVARQLVPASVAATRAADTICRVLERTDR